MPLDQTTLPIILTLTGGEAFASSFPVPFLFGGPGGIVRPQSLSWQRPSRGTVIGTAIAGKPFLEDFGQGVPQLIVHGHTSWSQPGQRAGLPGLKALEVLFQEYLTRRQRTAAALGDPDSVKLTWIDVLDATAFSVYPIEFAADRSAKPNPLLYYYRMRFWVVRDLLADLVDTITDDVFSWLNDTTGIFTRLDQVGAAFGSVGNVFGGLF